VWGCAVMFGGLCVRKDNGLCFGFLVLNKNGLENIITL